MLGRQNQGSLQTGHAFKAQMVTHFVISMHFRGNLEIYSKTYFHWISSVGAEFMNSDGKLHFSGLGLPKHVPDAYVYKGNHAGCQEDAFGSEKWIFWASRP